MKKITIVRKGDIIIGAVRVPKDIHDKLKSLAKDHKCSIQEIIKYVLELEIFNFE